MQHHLSFFYIFNLKITSVTLLNEKFVLIISLSVDITPAFNRPTL